MLAGEASTHLAEIKKEEKIKEFYNVLVMETREPFFFKKKVTIFIAQGNWYS